VKKLSGVYLIKNVVNDKVYVGSSVSVNCRKRKHFEEPMLAKEFNVSIPTIKSVLSGGSWR
jgi:hypothetical protein